MIGGHGRQLEAQQLAAHPADCLSWWQHTRQTAPHPPAAQAAPGRTTAYPPADSRWAPPPLFLLPLLLPWLLLPPPPLMAAAGVARRGTAAVEELRRGSQKASLAMSAVLRHLQDSGERGC